MQSGTMIKGYQIIKKLGQGSFGVVMLAQNKNELYAIKSISKDQIMKASKMHQPFIEKQMLLKLNECKYDLFIKIHDTFSDDQNVYLMLQYCEGSTLEYVISQKLTHQTICRIAVKIILMLEQLSHYHIIHRDLKPSNILVNLKGQVKLSDFGTAYAPEQFYGKEVAQVIKNIRTMAQQKKMQKSKDISNVDQDQIQTGERRSTFVGTACYMAPQLLSQDHCGPQSDIWAFGCILYEMIYKKSPFSGANQGVIWKNILNNEIQIELNEKQSDDLLACKDLLKKIFVKEKQKRIGFEGIQIIKKHQFFKCIDWQKQKISTIEELAQIVNKQLTKGDKLKQSGKSKVLLSESVEKKMYFGNWKERTLVLYSDPKLEYYQTESGEKKGEIILSKDTPVQSQGAKIFMVTAKKTYYFKTKQAQSWKTMIKLAIAQKFY